MAKIPTPDRGQPIDVSYIYQIVEAVNELSSQASSSTYKYTTVDTTNGQQSFVTSETKMVGGEASVYSTLTTVTAGQTQQFSYPFKGEFKYAPIVSATPVLIEGTTAGQDISVIIQSVTTSNVTGVVRFDSSGSLAVKVHIIAIGVPH